MAKHESSISLLDAVETLSNIADLDPNLSIAQDHDFIFQNRKISYKTVHWITKKNSNETIKLVKDIFKVILDYLHNFYDKEYNMVTDAKTLEGIKTIMVLVGEAAKKLDKYSSLFQKTKEKSVTDLREYKKLQEFYLTRIARKIDQDPLSKRMLNLTRKALIQKPTLKLSSSKSSTPHFFVDLETVKKDTDYELFFLRKEDGSRFYSPRLIRNIQLICDFGNYFEFHQKGEDPLTNIKIWIDKSYQIAAKNILIQLGNRLTRFLREAFRYKDQELVEYLNKGLLALMLASNPNHLGRTMPLKNCGGYFNDFQHFLREALQSQEFQKLVAYPQNKRNKLSHCILDNILGICIALFEGLQFYQDFSPKIAKLIQEAKLKHPIELEHAENGQKTLWTRLANDYQALSKFVKRHPNGPMGRVLDLLQEGGRQIFDPLWQQNLPCKLFAIEIQNNRILNIHLPSPTVQEFVNKANVNEEFKNYLRACLKGPNCKKHLMINLQNRTSWRENVRCVALEELQKLEEFDKQLIVVTLPKDTEFYHQLAPYNRDNHTTVFLDHLRGHVNDLNAGFYLPENLKKTISPRFINGLTQAILRIFFSNKNVLTREQRMDFIEIFYLFLKLKLIEITKPDSFSLTCKDGADIGATANASLMGFLKLMNAEQLSETDLGSINAILHTPAMLNRERVVHPSRFNRMLSALRSIESTRSTYGQEKFLNLISKNFSPLYKTPLWKAKIHPD